MSGRGKNSGKGLGVRRLIMDPDAFASIVLRIVSKENADRLAYTTEEWKTDPELQHDVYTYLENLHPGDASRAAESIRDRLELSTKARLTRKTLIDEVRQIVESFDTIAYRFRPGGQVFQGLRTRWQQNRTLLQQHHHKQKTH